MTSLLFLSVQLFLEFYRPVDRDMSRPAFDVIESTYRYIIVYLLRNGKIGIETMDTESIFCLFVILFASIAMRMNRLP